MTFEQKLKELKDYNGNLYISCGKGFMYIGPVETALDGMRQEINELKKTKQRKELKKKPHKLICSGCYKEV